MLHRGRDTSAVCWEAERETSSSSFPYLNLLQCPACMGKHTINWTRAFRASGDSFQPKALLPAQQTMHSFLGGRRIFHHYYSHMHRSLSLLQALLPPVISWNSCKKQQAWPPKFNFSKRVSKENRKSVAFGNRTRFKCYYGLQNRSDTKITSAHNAGF